MAVQETTMTISWTNPAGSSKGQRVDAKLQLFPDQPAVDQLTISKWLAIYDLYKGKDTTIGGKIRFIAYGTDTLLTTDDVINLDPNNPARPAISIIILPPNVMLSAVVFVNPNTGTADASESAEAKVVIADSYEEIVEHLGLQGGE